MQTILTLDEAKETLGIEENYKDSEIQSLLNAISASLSISIGEIKEDDSRCFDIAKTIVRLMLWDDYYKVNKNKEKITYYIKMLQIFPSQVI